MNNEQPVIPPVTYSVELIAKRKEEKKKELLRSKQRIGDLTQELFSPQRSKNKLENMMQHINAGIAAYDGLRTGIMILQRIRKFLGKKETKNRPSK